MKKIDKDNKIFSSPEFQKEKYKFNILIKNLESKTLQLYSDEENYVICRGAEGLPTWIWTRDNIDINLLPEIKQAMKLYLTDREKNKFTCKKELYNLLLESGYKGINTDDYFEMGFLLCEKTKKPKDCDGSLAIPNEQEQPIIASYWFDDCNEMNGVDSISREQAEKDAREMIESKRFYVWKNPKGKIVCMVMYKEEFGQARLNHVFTPIEERGKGYAANLIYEMTNQLLDKGLVPLLYTDYNYPPSNKAYINAGYEDKGILINFSCSKERLLFKENAENERE